MHTTEHISSPNFLPLIIFSVALATSANMSLLLNIIVCAMFMYYHFVPEQP